MIATLGLTVRLVRGPIEREQDGLAMSSRNIRLSPEGRQKAGLISTTLFQAKKEAQHLPLSQVKLTAVQTLEDAGITIDYFEIVDGNQLHRIDNFEDANLVTACTTVVIDGVRLLDNIILKENKVH
jgi:pantoate--beta-alanine ligase